MLTSSFSLSRCFDIRPSVDEEGSCVFLSHNAVSRRCPHEIQAHAYAHAHAHVSASLKSLFTFSWKLEKCGVTSNLLRGPLRRPLSKDLFFVRPRIFLIYEGEGYEGDNATSMVVCPRRCYSLDEVLIVNYIFFRKFIVPHKPPERFLRSMATATVCSQF